MNQPPWTITRRWIDRHDAQRRWDKAYQMLLGQADPRAGDGPDGVADAPAQKSAAMPTIAAYTRVSTQRQAQS